MAISKISFVEKLFAEHRGALQQFFQRRLRTKSDAADLAQEVYVRMLRVRDTETIRDPQRYLYSVASNLVKEHASRDQRQFMQLDVDDASVQEQLANLPSLDGEVDAAREAERLNAALAQLPPRWRLALILQHRYELSYEEIGDRLGVSASMVKKYLAQGLGHCRRLMVGAD
jgi:RNA polymerase sigma factor (sigma-70 family)